MSTPEVGEGEKMEQRRGSMESFETWYVRSIKETAQGTRTAELEFAIWSTRNPRASEGDPDEFIDAEPGEKGAEFVLMGSTMEWDVTELPGLRPGGHIRIEVQPVLAKSKVRPS